MAMIPDWPDRAIWSRAPPRTPTPTLTATTVIVATNAVTVHACARPALARLSDDEGAM